MKRRRKRSRKRANGYDVTGEGGGVALTNAEKQARWRLRHADQRRRVARIATTLMRRSHSTGRAIETKVGWNAVTFDEYFYTLATLICGVLKTDKAIKQLRWALAKCLHDRARGREAARDARLSQSRIQARHDEAA
jgi:hypothetical protein